LSVLDRRVDRERDRLVGVGNVERGEEHRAVAGAESGEVLLGGPAPERLHRYSGWSCQRGAVRAVRRYRRRHLGRNPTSQPTIANGTREMNDALTKTISGTRIAAAPPANPSASSLWRLMLRSRRSYSSAGI